MLCCVCHISDVPHTAHDPCAYSPRIIKKCTHCALIVSSDLKVAVSQLFLIFYNIRISHPAFTAPSAAPSGRADASREAAPVQPVPHHHQHHRRPETSPELQQRRRLPLGQRERQLRGPA